MQKRGIKKIQIVIDTPEDETFIGYYTRKDGINTYHSCKSNFIVLPKHGRLKDVDEYFKISWEHSDYDLGDDALTILEATGVEK